MGWKSHSIWSGEPIATSMQSPLTEGLRDASRRRQARMWRLRGPVMESLFISGQAGAGNFRSGRLVRKRLKHQQTRPSGSRSWEDFGLLNQGMANTFTTPKGAASEAYGDNAPAAL